MLKPQCESYRNGDCGAADKMACQLASAIQGELKVPPALAFLAKEVTDEEHGNDRQERRQKLLHEIDEPNWRMAQSFDHPVPDCGTTREWRTPRTLPSDSRRTIQLSDRVGLFHLVSYWLLNRPEAGIVKWRGCGTVESDTTSSQ